MDTSALPHKLGRYEITSVLGRGAMGVVYEGRDPALDRAVAIKTLNKQHLDDPEVTARFLREARAVARLQHPHIVSVFDAGEEDDLAYMVMELVRGESLQQRLEPGCPLVPAEALSITKQLLDALGYAHGFGIVHRDIKPANVMLDAQGQVKLADFGVARVDDDPDTTRVGTVIGTPRYMAPEQFTGQAVGPETDIFAAGVLLYRMLTGQDPFGGETPFQIMQAVIQREPVPPSQMAGVTLLEALDSVVLRALAKQPERRYSNARAFASALQAATPDDLSQTPGTLCAPESGAVASHPLSLDTGTDCTIVGSPTWSVPGINDGTIIGGRSPDAVPPVPASLPTDGTMFISAAPPASAADVLPAVQLVVTTSPDPGLVGRVVPVDVSEFLLGRDPAANLVLQDYHCSRRHAFIRFEAGRFVVVDLESSNGTLLDGCRLTPGQPAPLLFGAAIRIGETTLTFSHVRDTTLPDLTGRLLAGRYRLERVLRASPKATVYEARVSGFGGTVALKLMSAELADYPGYRESFREAAEAAMRLQHPYICPMLDHGLAEVSIGGRVVSIPYVCHTMLAGGSLAARMAERTPIETAQIGRWVTQIAAALAHAHRRDVVHGDLKPTSIVFDTEDHAYVMDFTVAGAPAAPSTLTGRPLVGAPAFMAPEQWQGKAPTVRTDQFALAVLAYVMLTGTRPFVGQEDPQQRERNFRRGPPPAHEEVRLAGRNDVPYAVSDVLRRALASDPGARFESIERFAEAFENALQRRVRASHSPTVFVSYCHECSAGWAVLMARELKERHGIAVFVDTERIDAAVKFPAKLARAIECCEVFVCLLGASTLQSRWVREEIRLAHYYGRPMIPVFQESFEQYDSEDSDPAVEALLQYDGVHLLDRRNIHVDHTIDDLARLVMGTVRAPAVDEPGREESAS